jgi:CRP/FNR family nitrogen fixation transcriptional regulator
MDHVGSIDDCSQPALQWLAASNAPRARLAREAPIDAAIKPFAALKTFRRAQEIAGSNGPATHWYRVVSGVARDCVFLANGRRQILDLLLTGDFFGVAGNDAAHRNTIEAVVDGTTIASFPRPRVEALAEADPCIARFVRTITLDAVARARTRMLVLGRMNALERVGSFLSEMAARSYDARAGAIVLPLSRYDIADYLGLSVETVCRTFSDLHRRNIIATLRGHRVRIIDRDALLNG